MDERQRWRIFERDEGKCQTILPNGRKCLAPAAEVHHRIPKGMGGRHGQAKIESEKDENLECQCLACKARRHG